MKRMKHFLSRIKTASKVKHVQPKPPKPGMQCRDWLSQQERAYHIDNIRAIVAAAAAAKAKLVLNDLGTDGEKATP